MRPHRGWRALAATALLLGATTDARAHGNEPVGKVTGDLSFADPAPAGLSYEWTIRMHRKQEAQIVNAVGAKSWSEPSNPDGLKGWTHTSNWIALELDDAATVTITVEAQQGVVVTSGATAAAARSALIPAVSLYSGWDDTTEVESHTFNSSGGFWSTIVYETSAPNPKSKPKVVLKAKLAAGRYSVVIGGIPRSLGDPSAYPTPTCDPVDPTCYAYTGLQGYRATIKTK